jgi:LysM repeat protein
MARAMIPTAGLAERRDPLALPAVDFAWPGDLTASVEPSAGPQLSAWRAAAPRPSAKRPAPVSTPSGGELAVAPAAAPAAMGTTVAPAMAPARAASTSAPVTRPMVTASLPKSSRSPVPAGGETNLVPGRLTLPVFVARPVTGAAPRSRTYQVKRGDRLQTIAERFRVTPTSILVANGLQSASTLRPGRKLLIPGTFDIVLNNRRVAFDVSPRIDKGLPIAPFRHLFEQAGGVVVYYPGDRSVKAAKPDKEVRLQIGNTQALVDGAVVVMERAPLLDGGRTMVPVRFVTEALDMVAEYDVKTGSIYLVRK